MDPSCAVRTSWTLRRMGTKRSRETEPERAAARPLQFAASTFALERGVLHEGASDSKYARFDLRSDLELASGLQFASRCAADNGARLDRSTHGPCGNGHILGLPLGS